jgi:hypothetical protein
MIEFLYDNFAISTIHGIFWPVGLDLIGPPPWALLVFPTKSSSPPNTIIVVGLNGRIVLGWRWIRLPLQYPRITKSCVEKQAYQL